jgi:hypothetical protein
MTLFDPPYPDDDKGIAVYAGHDNEVGRLPPLSAISTSSSPVYTSVWRSSGRRPPCPICGIGTVRRVAGLVCSN